MFIYTKTIVTIAYSVQSHAVEVGSLGAAGDTTQPRCAAGCVCVRVLYHVRTTMKSANYTFLRNYPHYYTHDCINKRFNMK